MCLYSFVCVDVCLDMCLVYVCGALTLKCWHLFSLSEEDKYGSYSRMILKYFLAEGVVCGHELFIASAQDHPEDVLQVRLELVGSC